MFGVGAARSRRPGIGIGFRARELAGADRLNFGAGQRDFAGSRWVLDRVVNRALGFRADDLIGRSFFSATSSLLEEMADLFSISTSADGSAAWRVSLHPSAFKCHDRE